MNPYLVLGVPRTADDAAIRRAYLEGVKEAPPETHPDRFKALTAAYEKIGSETKRYRYELFDTECPGESPLEAFARQAADDARRHPLPYERLKELFRLCSKT